MNVKQLFAFGVLTAASPAAAWAQSVPSQDSILGSSSFAYGGNTAGLAMSGHDQVVAAESTISLSASFLHHQYHENILEGSGDDENGLMAGFGVGLSGLIPFPPLGADIYTDISYDFNAGDITYGGHYLYSGLPAFATDNAVFQRLEVRVGVGLPVAGGVEVIPYAAGGYQSWNRNINQKGLIGTDEFYSSGLFGGGVKLDVPAGPRFVLSGDGEVLALGGGRVDFNSVGGGGNFGITAEERAELGVDYLLTPRFHTFAKLYWEHFDYSGSKPSLHTPDFYEPLSTTIQFGANVGVAYSFY